ncbi:glucokinase [Thorsellia anophelis]|uniref:Glucokinase n=1 Tax=Thorsellia anophelis DSM 18579 TaxID=1123402 RepID=A0A1I0DV13_9GAMM|nr:glucokinase [Thorsellia anophelis]SET35639.1 glucokinase [Thorsellia anophelis DSM 18579]
MSVSIKLLVGDIGGTNARLGLCDFATGEISQIENYPTADYPGIESVIEIYLAKHATPSNIKIDKGCLAIATAITSDKISMTNNHWSFSITEVKNRFGFTSLFMINDFTAVSMAIPMLSDKDVIQFGGQAAHKDKPIGVYGAGTGLGVSYLIPADGKWVTFPAEGGHVEFSPSNDEEIAILNYTRKFYQGRVSAERILSGMGLVNIYNALCEMQNITPEQLEPKDITERALSQSCKICQRTLENFCILLGRFGGNLALTLGAFGGIYLAGGIVPRFLSFFEQSDFRKGFEDKGRFSEYMEKIPVFLITHPQTGLLGSGAFIRQELGIKL